MDLPKKIDRYFIRKLIGEGGMGQVFLAYDSVADREVALKRIRPDLIQHEPIRNRFLKEAKIAAQLTHPAILPVFSLEQNDQEIYYVMPYIQGKTLKHILAELRRTRAASLHLLRPFLSVLHALKYAHSRGVLHRDIKPENILIGPFSEVFLCDFGLADYRNEETKEEELFPVTQHYPNLTRVGKVVGTITYMAPERVINRSDSVEGDIYSLGVILYQILTLKKPFHRKSLKAFRESASEEILVDPIEAAPNREISSALSKITKKCLEFSKEKRYHSIDDLIRDVEQYLEGRAEWIFNDRLSIQQLRNWKLQETVILPQKGEWAVLGISADSYPGHLKIELSLLLQPETEGMGLLLALPGQEEKDGLEAGYCLWIQVGSIRLLRSGIEVKNIVASVLEADIYHEIIVEKSSDAILVYLNEMLLLSYKGFQPLIGAHLGLLYKDLSFSLQNFSVFVGSYHAKVGCLTIPDAFLAARYFDRALFDYEKIARSFEGRFEGFEALFRQGLTLIEMGLYSQAHEIFSRFHKTRYGIREWLGKALVYRKEKDVEEEAKCFEIALVLFSNDPELSLIEEEISFRLAESRKESRKAPYYFLYLIERYKLGKEEWRADLINNLLSPLETPRPLIGAPSWVLLAFWLGKEKSLTESQEKSALLAVALLNGKEEEKELMEKSWIEELLVERDLPYIKEAYPPLSLLFSYCKQNQLSKEWASDAFPYEKRILQEIQERLQS